MSNQKALRWLDTAVIVAAVGTLPLIVVETQGIRTPWTIVADWIIWLVFLFDFVADFWRRVSLGRKCLSLAIVAVSFPLLPDLLALTRLARLTRLAGVFRIAFSAGRAAQAVQRVVGRTGVRYVASVFLLSLLVGGTLFYVVEPKTAGSVWNGMWWAIVTATTVGYGDIAPATLLGRTIGGILMLLGIGVFATFGGAVAAYFVESDSEHQLDRIEDRLGHIEELLNRSPRSGR